MKKALSLLLLSSLATQAAAVDIPVGSTVNVEQVLNIGDNLTLGGTIDGTAGNAISANGANTIDILSTGQVINSGSYGIELQSTDHELNVINNAGLLSNNSNGEFYAELYLNSTLTLNNSGIIDSNSSNYALELYSYNNSAIELNNSGSLLVGRVGGYGGVGIYAEANDNSRLLVNNSGDIDATRGMYSYGMEIYSYDQSYVEINNSGTITIGGGEAIYSESYDDSYLEINNYGTMRSTDGGYSIDAYAYDDSRTVINNYALLTGDDSYAIYGEAEDNAILTINNYSNIIDTDTAIESYTYNGGEISVNNMGSIKNSASDGIYHFYSSRGGKTTINNFGEIDNSGDYGISVRGIGGSETIVITNSGSISNSGRGGIYIRDAYFGTSAVVNVINDSGVMRNNAGAAVTFSGADETMSIRGFSAIEGLIDGGAGTDTLVFENMFLSPEKITEIEALTGDGSVVINGETFTWANFENVNTNNLQTLDEFLSAPELQGFATALQNVDGLSDTDVQSFLGDLSRIDDAEVRSEIVKSATGVNSNNYFGQEAQNWVGAQSRQVAAYFNQRRQGYSGFASSGLRQFDRHLPLSMQEGYSPLYASLEQVPEPELQVEQKDWSGFFQVGGSLTENDANDSYSKGFSATLGFDRQISRHMTLGAYVGYGYTDAKTDALGSKVAGRSGHVGLYGSYDKDDVFVEGVLGYRVISYDQTRALAFSSNTALSETLGQQFNTSWKVGQNIDFGKNDKWTVTPQAGLAYSHLFIDSYREEGAGSLSLEVEDQNADSLRSEIGVELSRRFTGKKGWIKPAVDMTWVHEFMDDARGVRTNFAGGDFDSFEVRTSNPDRDFVRFGASLGGSGAKSKDVYTSIRYDVEVGRSDIEAHNITFDVRMNF